MHALPSLLDEALQRIAAGPLCVGFSGGLDSTVLLHALASLPAARARGLRAWHVHHGLHEDADRWAAHCEEACAALGVPLTVTRVDVARDRGHGPEAAARQARHASFREGLTDGEILVFAHHRDDQAETFLLRAMRASGADGLGAMQAWRGFGHGHLWRPLLGVSRATLERYAAAHGLRWIEDPSNADESFDRNFLRQRVLPLLRERWPHASASLARSAALCEEAAELLDVDDARALAGVTAVGPAVDDGPGERNPASLSRSRLSGLAPSRRARVLRRWIGALGLPPLPAQGIAQVESALLAARDDASATFEWHGAVIYAWRDLLHVGVVQPPLPEDWQVDWDGIEPLALPGGGTLRLRALVGAASAANQSRSTDALARSPALPPQSRRTRHTPHVGNHVQVAADTAATPRGKSPWGTEALDVGDTAVPGAAEGLNVHGAMGAVKASAATGGFGRSLRVHARRGGERITLPGRAHSHALKQVLQDLGIPPWQRARLPLLSTAEGELLAAGDRVRSAVFEQWLREHGMRMYWCPVASDPRAD